MRKLEATKSRLTTAVFWGDLRWTVVRFAVICGVSGWFAVVCGLICGAEAGHCLKHAGTPGWRWDNITGGDAGRDAGTVATLY